MTKVTKKIELSFALLIFYDSVVVSTVKEDMVVEQEHVEELRKICTEHFGDRNFAYITNRKNNYNVNPVVYIDLVRTNRLKAIAVVSENLDRLKTANFEKNFSPVPYELFNHEEEAIVWANSIVSAN
ncbi:hypothetical protein GCM10023115_53980 [Pontixanthobacter gangjinensis]|uniref:STAS/SEC14 domain-containing protein n=1 Tax=Christiangramia aestuarii TaxID=1028746 RepID=A0A7K1LQD9_9FLAO|nr:hypothetical protein [Christiangramia aestuarii]MUP42978.1 hypothetical protein [Christiangramia aestuarii]